jgi:hypothetical protein
MGENSGDFPAITRKIGGQWEETRGKGTEPQNPMGTGTNTGFEHKQTETANF